MQTTTRVAVTVTFLRLDRPVPNPVRPLPAGVNVVRVLQPSLAFYRYLYTEIGAPYLWWLRRSLSDAALGAILSHPAVSVHVLYEGGEPAGFYELDARQGPSANLSYFGLMPRLIGRGMGSAFLRDAVDAAWRTRASFITVNTCTADHPRALPGYLSAGFRPLRSVRELWDIPTRLGLVVPQHLRV